MSQNKKTEKKSPLLSRLFRNNTFLIVLSFLIAFSAWLVTGVSTSEEEVRNIAGVAITINLSDTAKEEGYMLFEGDGQTATVIVTGNKIVVNNLDESDFHIVAIDAGSIVSAGKYPVTLEARKAGMKNEFNYDILSVSPSKLDIFVDKKVTKEFDIAKNFSYEVPQDYYCSDSFNPIVTVTGPETIINSIVRAEVSVKIEGVLQKTTELERDIIFYDEADEVVDDSFLSYTKKIPIKILVMPQKNIGLSFDFLNAPTGLDKQTISYSIEPKNILVAADQEDLDNLKTIPLESIDFKNLSNKKHTFTKQITLDAKYKNISNVMTAEITVDFSKYSSKEIYLSKFTNFGMPDGYASKTITQSLPVTIIGSKDEIEKITADDISGTIDFSAMQSNFVGSTSMPVKITTSLKYTTCWAKGDYSANVEISKSNNVTPTANP